MTKTVDSRKSRSVVIATAGMLLFSLFVGTARVDAQDIDVSVGDTLLTAEGWALFAQNIGTAIRTGNEGQRESALRHIVGYGKYLEFDRTLVFDVMWIYRNHSNDHLRHLSVLALANMKDRWAIEFMDMIGPFEKTDNIRATMARVVADFRAADN